VSRINGDIIAGLVMLAGAAIWFFWGLAVGRVFYVGPPILCLLGIIEIVRGFKGEA
jgi:hypothetical protein